MKPIEKKCNVCGSKNGYYIKEYFQVPVKVFHTHNHEKTSQKTVNEELKRVRVNAYARCVDCDSVLYDARVLSGTGALENFNVGFGDVKLYE